MTEAEAAAANITTAGFDLQEGDHFIICDAGGGTTDLTAFKITNVKGDSVDFTLLCQPFGDSIGSVQIDHSFEKLVTKRLEPTNRKLNATSYNTIMQTFLDIKHEFGLGVSNLLDTFTIPVPGLSPENEKLEFSREDISGLFNVQVDRMISLIDEQMKILEKPNSTRSPTLVLCGGLGSSPYVRKALEDEYRKSGMTIKVLDDPQLAVCKGLVKNALKPIFTNCYSPESFGILCNTPRAKDGGAIYKECKIDGKKYVIDQVEWFIRKGQVHDKGWISRPFYHLTRSGKQNVWTDKIVVPISSEPGYKPIYDMTTEFSPLPIDKGTSGIKWKYRKWLMGRYLEIPYMIGFRLEHSAPQFRVLFDNDEKSNVKINWPPKEEKLTEGNWLERPVKDTGGK